MPGRDAGLSVKEVSPKNPSAREAPRALLSCHARRSPRARLVRFRPPRHPPSFDRDTENTRKLGCCRQALLGLAWFRDKADVRRLGAGSVLSQATACRYLAEVIDVLSAEAPGLREALERAVAEGTPYVIPDGKIVDAGRC